jgi:hypothetical protein
VFIRRLESCDPSFRTLEISSFPWRWQPRIHCAVVTFILYELYCSRRHIALLCCTSVGLFSEITFKVFLFSFHVTELYYIGDNTSVFSLNCYSALSLCRHHSYLAVEHHLLLVTCTNTTRVWLEEGLCHWDRNIVGNILVRMRLVTLPPRPIIPRAISLAPIIF